MSTITQTYTNYDGEVVKIDRTEAYTVGEKSYTRYFFTSTDRGCMSAGHEFSFIMQHQVNGPDLLGIAWSIGYGGFEECSRGDGDVTINFIGLPDPQECEYFYKECATMWLPMGEKYTSIKLNVETGEECKDFKDGCIEYIRLFKESDLELYPGYSYYTSLPVMGINEFHDKMSVKK